MTDTPETPENAATFEANLRRMLQTVQPQDLATVIAQAQQTCGRIDAHLQANMAYQLIALIESQLFIADAKQQPITKQAISETCAEFVNSYANRNPAASKVAERIVQHLSSNFDLGIAVPSAGQSIYSQQVFNLLADYSDIADAKAYVNRTPIFGGFEFCHTLKTNKDLLGVLRQIPETGANAGGLPYRMNDEEAEVLKRELDRMLQADMRQKTFSLAERKAMPKELAPYAHSQHGYTSSDVTTAYKHMFGMGGSPGYHKAVNKIFEHLLTAAISFEKAPRMALIGSPFAHDDTHVLQSKVRMREALLSHGAHPVEIDVAKPPASYKDFDGIVLTGNDWDIDPQDYTRPDQPVTTHEKTKSELTRENYASDADYALGLARREQETAAINTAFEHRIPLFGVCGGMQRINVVKGGTLKQHVEGGNQGTLPENTPPHTPTRCVQVLEGSKLAFLANGQTSAFVPTFADNTGPLTLQQAKANINSYHHQVIDNVGEGLKRNASAALIDRPGEITIMGIESREPQKHFVMGVQWHPEFMPNAQLSKNILGGVVAAAQSHAKSKGTHAAVGAQTEAVLAETPGGGIVKT